MDSENLVPVEESISKQKSQNRRKFLSNASKGMTGALLLGRSIKARAASNFDLTEGNPLRMPTSWVDGEDLVVTQEQLGIWSGYQTTVYAINGIVPGPTIRLKRGQSFRTRVVNNLPGEPLVIHWHGLLAPESMDGHPAFQVASGQSYEIDFPIVQREATCWYHTHTDRLTAEQAYKGLAGLFIIEEPEQEKLGLPSEEHDVPLVLTDLRSNAERQLRYAPSMMDTMSGYLGDTVLVNGTPEPWHAVDHGLYRLRLLNASNARIYRLAFSDERSFKVIANDGGFLPEVSQVNSVILAPGQRLEILVEFENVPVGNTVTLRSLGMPRDVGPTGYSQASVFDILTFRVEFSSGGSASGVESWPELKIPQYAEVSKRQFTLNSFMMRHTINGRSFEIKRVDFEIKQGEWEIWEFTNQAMVYHPMHVHAAHFWILERSGISLAPEDGGWRDTVLVAPGDTVKVLIRFEAYAGVFLTHCHNLEHEDSGMMLNFRVIPKPQSDLKIEYDGEQYEVSWSEVVQGQLESTTDLSSPQWDKVPIVPQLENGRFIVRVTSNDANRFFRLSDAQIQ